MRLGILIPEFPTQTHVFFWREIEALRSLGVEVHVLSTRRPVDDCPHEFAVRAAAETHYVYPPSKRAVLRSMADWRGVGRSLSYVLGLSEPGRRRVRAMGFALCGADLARYARARGLDHLHAHSCADAAHVVAMAYLMGGPAFSLHLHGDLPVYGTDHRQKTRHAVFVAAAARSMQRQLVEQAGVPEERTCTLWMGVDTERFRPPPERPLRAGVELVTVGRLNPWKGHRYALEAIRSLVDGGLDVRYAIIGSGPDRAAIEADVARLRLADRVRMMGSLPEEKVRAELYAADAFLLSSVGLGEASPVAVMEAMACGLPVVSSIIGGTPDMISDGTDGLLVPQHDVKALAGAIRRLASEPERRRLGAAARARAVRQFDCRATARRLLDMIEASRSRRAAARDARAGAFYDGVRRAARRPGDVSRMSTTVSGRRGSEP